jgi:putative membrane protein insertion efficiency factor
VNTARRSLWTAGAPVRTVFVWSIRVYRRTLSGWLGGQCRFYPTCSVYAEDAIRNRGAIRGLLRATWRILRCNPFGAGGVETPPTARYDEVIRRGEKVGT